MDQPFRDRFKNPYAVIHRADLHGVLHDACVAHPDVTLVNDERVVAYENTATGAKVVTEAGHVFEGDAVIGADGVRSKIREQLTGGDALKLSGHVAYRAVLPIEDMPEDLRWNAATLWAGPKCHMVHYPLQGWKTFNLGRHLRHRHRERRHQRARHLRGSALALRRHRAPRPQAARSAEDLAALGVGPIATRSRTGPTATSCWSATPPIRPTSISRKALCMALEDAVCLGDALARHEDFNTAFLAYQTLRIPRAYRVILSSRELGRVYHAQGVERLVRNKWLGDKTPDGFYDSLAWLYGGNGLSG